MHLLLRFMAIPSWQKMASALAKFFYTVFERGNRNDDIDSRSFVIYLGSRIGAVASNSDSSGTGWGAYDETVIWHKR
jgi:hypothetical protein